MLRRDRDEVTTTLTALATLHVQGVKVDWAPLFAGVRPADLPTSGAITLPVTVAALACHKARFAST